ncbi:pimeloyl-ACP methyl ester carboxylesterase [Friedmanniella endophytica]|uniref:Pimeloyl-ACP methyl ester carboxylesterase n=1 Tax=Microlunatus kandeliicorticis TaxID=1759536 RepID=A0A7W3ITD6_9ACTN|nr:alpha/beta hydrolase [Microlunatus kandeliicorticis]MBA8794903.1 pimeloyl-ACP methyl ester carboxylesterase [Microlunatus kandeliicorticis]
MRVPSRLRPSPHLLATGLLATGLLAGSLLAPSPVASATPGAGAAAAGAAASATRAATAATAATKPKPAKTSATEARRLSRVKTPKLGWTRCPSSYRDSRLRCSWLTVPLDYDKPTGAKLKVRLLKNPATDRAHRIGSLFVNPGGPGGSAVELAAEASSMFSPALRRQFDIVGMDPRGTNASSPLRCFSSTAAQTSALSGFAVGFPVTAAEQKAHLRSAAALARACANRGRATASAMSTAEVARDMELARRAVKDSKLNYLGFSYGTYLGEVYANLFPDRFRVLAIDGVIDPTTWAGTSANRNTPLTARLRSAEGSWKALKELMRRCDAAGPTRCDLAGGTRTAQQKFALLADRLRAHPLQTTDGTISYALWISYVGQELYDSTAGPQLMTTTAQLLAATDSSAARSASTAALQRALARTLHEARQIRGLGYDDSQESYSGVQCSDGLEPSSPSAWAGAARKADAAAPYFGASWTWASAPCATATWKAHDEDAYRGPFTKRTAATILVVGNTWDPATNYANAQRVDTLMPNTRLLSSRSWGHTAYGTSSCVTRAVDRYLLTRKLPAYGTTCTGAYQPFAGSASSRTAATLQKSIAADAAAGPLG